MKKIKQITCFSLFLSIIMILSACNANAPLFGESQTADTSKTTEQSAYSEMIRELENKILDLQQNQYASDAEQQKELQRLQTLLSELKSQLPNKNDPDNPETDTEGETDSKNNENSNTAKFIYTKEGNLATITGYTGTDAHLVIPAVIDGYTVTAIGDHAFSSTYLKSVVISNGISKIDWFAFQECPSLVSVTIPSSVISIGYSAFSPQSDSFTIYCHNDSFAQKYAKSYGWNYAII